MTFDLLRQDAENRQRALALASFIVEAPAGAGKTELLTQRYLKLLAVVGAPEEIVAITFTNKAAAEMRGRILDSLQRAAANEAPQAAHKRITFDLARQALSRSADLGWQLLEQPARLRINTIDSLCGYLARQLPILSGFGGQPRVVEDAAPHCREAARRALATLEQEAGQGVVTEALRYLDNDAVRLGDLLAAMLAKRDQWLQHAGNVGEAISAALQALVTQEIALAASVVPPAVQARLMPLARFAASHLQAAHPIAPLRDWETPLPPQAQALPWWRALCELLLTGDGAVRKTVDVRLGFPKEGGGEQKQAMIALLAELTDIAPLARIKLLPDPQSAAEQRLVAALARLLQLAAGHLLVVFQEAGEVDFVEIAHRALLALHDESGATDLALQLDYRIQHLLVDEFQDTSPAQVQLLQRLTAGWVPGDGRTLFCVGDPMQSIYRFRKADVGLFLGVAAHGIGDLPLEPLHLTRNNRSCPALVAWVNDAFAPVFPARDDPKRGAIRYRPFAATRASMPGEGVFVQPLLLAQAHDSDAIHVQEARALADLILRERAQYPQASMAVLVRARSHLEALVSEIRSRHPDLRFQAVEIEALAGRQAVQDIHALTRALCHRADRLHWLAILRAPWCGLTLQDLHALAADDHHSTLWQLMQDQTRLARLSADGRQRLRHVRGVLAEAYAHQGRMPLRRWVEAAWLKLGGPQCLWEAGDVRDVQAYLALLEDMTSLDAVLLQTRMEKLFAAPDTRADGTLQFMTIHKSKGLEFDIVILPGLHRASKNNDAQLLLWDEVPLAGGQLQLVAAPYVPKHKRGVWPSSYEYLQSLERERDANELARLLYVAATRAKHRLHLVAALKQDSQGACKAPGGTLLELLWQQVGAAFMTAALVAATESVPDAAAFIPRLIRLPQPGSPDGLPVPAAAHAAEPPQGSAALDGATTLEASCGTLAHLYMEMMAHQGLAAWPPARLQALLPAMRRWLEQQGHAASACRQGAERVFKALCVTLASAAGQWVLQAHPQAASEWVLATVENGQVRQHVIDRTFVAEGARWVVDYKSARLGQASAAAAEAYRPQLERYARLFRPEGLPVRMAVFFLASGELVELKP